MDTISNKTFKTLKPEARHIFNLIQKEGGLSKAEITKLTNLKTSTLNYMMEPLHHHGLIIETHTGESTGGRKPVLYDINLCRFYIIGIHLTDSFTEIVFANLKLELFHKETIYRNPSHSPKDNLLNIIHVILTLQQDMSLNYITLLGAGLAVSGNPFPDDAKGCQLILEAKLNCTVFLDNGANCGTIAEYYYGSGKGADTLLYFDCGAEIKSGAIFSGKILRSIQNKENTFGLQLLRSGNCNHTDTGHASLQSQISVSSKEDAAVILGTALANYISLTAPDTVILKGSTVMNSKTFYNKTVETISALLEHYPLISFYYGGCFKENASVIGAAALVIEAQLGNPL